MQITELLYPADESNIYIHLSDGEELSIDIQWEEMQFETDSLKGSELQKKEKSKRIDRAIEILQLHNFRCERLKKLGSRLLLEKD